MTALPHFYKDFGKIEVVNTFLPPRTFAPSAVE